MKCMRETSLVQQPFPDGSGQRNLEARASKSTGLAASLTWNFSRGHPAYRRRKSVCKQVVCCRAPCLAQNKVNLLPRAALDSTRDDSRVKKCRSGVILVRDSTSCSFSYSIYIRLDTDRSTKLSLSLSHESYILSLLLPF